MTLIRHNFGYRAHPRQVQVMSSLGELRTELNGLRKQGRRIALVPTMGNLHEGHLSLVRKARQLADVVVTTIFVNPFQFGKNEDFETYPRTFDSDIDALDAEGCDILFAPQGRLIYPHGDEAVTRVEVPSLSNILCGESRPTYFRGVATVVNILLNMVQPDIALFGEKDYQQTLTISRMVQDLQMQVEIIPVATVREPDGLAMSSRNHYLTPAERDTAPGLYETLGAIRQEILDGDTDFHGLAQRGTEQLAFKGLRPDYFSIRRQADLCEPEPGETSLVILAAAWLGKARLIDNLKV